MPMGWPLSWVTSRMAPAVDVAHGYIALVIPDPQFTKDERGTAISESLGQ